MCEEQFEKLCRHHFFLWLLEESGLATITNVNRIAITKCCDLHRRAATGQEVTCEQWRSAWRLALQAATWSAAAAARSAVRSAADSAAREANWRAAERVARAAMDSMSGTEDSAALAATWLAADSAAAWQKIAVASLRIFREAAQR